MDRLNKNCHEKQIPTFLVEAVGSTAAGDCFVGVFGAVICEGQSFKAVTEFTSATAALSIVTHEGTQPSLPYREKSSLL